MIEEQRLRELETLSTRMEVRLSALELMHRELVGSIDSLRDERREDSQAVFKRLDEISANVSLHVGMRKAAAWIFGAGIALVAALVGFWNLVLNLLKGGSQ